MKHKKNRWLPLVILLCVLVLLLGGYAALSSANRKAEKEAETEEKSAEIIAEYDPATAETLSYTKDGTTLSFVNEGGTWYLEDDRLFPLDQTAVSSMASAISTIGVERTIDDGEPADYGLEDPFLTISIRYRDNVGREYKIGDRNSFNGEYYFMTGSRIYMISDGLLPYFDYTLDGLLLRDTFPTELTSDSVTEIRVETGAEAYTVDVAAEISDLLPYVRQLNFTSAADYHASDMAGDYGIDQTERITVTYKRSVTSTNESGEETTAKVDASYTIYLGKTEEDGSVYYAPQNSTIVYKSSAGVWENLLQSAREPLPEEETAEGGE